MAALLVSALLLAAPATAYYNQYQICNTTLPQYPRGYYDSYSPSNSEDPRAVFRGLLANCDVRGPNCTTLALESRSKGQLDGYLYPNAFATGGVSTAVTTFVPYGLALRQSEFTTFQVLFPGQLHASQCYSCYSKPQGYCCRDVNAASCDSSGVSTSCNSPYVFDKSSSSCKSSLLPPPALPAPTFISNYTKCPGVSLYGGTFESFGSEYGGLANDTTFFRALVADCDAKPNCIGTTLSKETPGSYTPTATLPNPPYYFGFSSLAAGFQGVDLADNQSVPGSIGFVIKSSQRSAFEERFPNELPASCYTCYSIGFGYCCKDQNASQCTDAGVALACNAPYSLDKSSSCVNKCPSTHYSNASRVCTPCSAAGKNPAAILQCKVTALPF